MSVENKATFTTNRIIIIIIKSGLISFNFPNAYFQRREVLLLLYILMEWNRFDLKPFPSILKPKCHRCLIVSLQYLLFILCQTFLLFSMSDLFSKLLEKWIKYIIRRSSFTKIYSVLVTMVYM